MSRKSIFFSIIAILAFILLVVIVFMAKTKPDKTKPIRHGNIISNITCPATQGTKELTDTNVSGGEPDTEESFLMASPNSSQAESGYDYDFRKLYIHFPEYYDEEYHNDEAIRTQPNRRQMHLICVYDHTEGKSITLPGRALGCNGLQEANLSCSTEVDADFPRDWRPVFDSLP